MCLIFLIKPQHKKTVMFTAMYQLKQVTVVILNCASFQFMLPYEQKGKSFKQTAFLSE